MTNKIIKITNRTLFIKKEDIFTDIATRVIHELERVFGVTQKPEYLVKPKSQELDILIEGNKILNVMMSSIECIVVEENNGWQELVEEFEIDENELKRIIESEPNLQNIQQPVQRTFEIILEVSIPESIELTDMKEAERILKEFEIKII